MADTSIRIDRSTLLDVENPDPKDIHLSDIAKVLSKANRFNSHGLRDRRISVAEHSLNVLALVKQETPYIASRDMAREYELAALLHDGHEYVITDIATPVKIAIGREHINRIGNKFDCAIGVKFGFDNALMKSVMIKRCDAECLEMEGDWLFDRHGDFAERDLSQIAKVHRAYPRQGFFSRKPKIGLTPDEAYHAFIHAYHNIIEDYGY